MKIGDKVKVNITHQDEWANSAVESINGKTGSIRSSNSSGNVVLVIFDTLCKPWHSNQLPVLGFHFHVNELEVIDEAHDDHS